MPAVVAALVPVTRDAPAETLRVESSDVRFVVRSLFEVEGRLAPLEGELEFDPGGGEVTGALRVDARSADTGYALRDAVIREDVLEVDRHPEIVFHAERWELFGRSATQVAGRLVGRLDLHGVTREIGVQLDGALDADGALWITARFRIDFTLWNIENPGNVHLPVEPGVQITARVRIDAGAARAVLSPPREIDPSPEASTR